MNQRGEPDYFAALGSLSRARRMWEAGARPVDALPRATWVDDLDPATRFEVMRLFCVSIPTEAAGRTHNLMDMTQSELRLTFDTAIHLCQRKCDSELKKG